MLAAKQRSARYDAWLPDPLIGANLPYAAALNRNRLVDGLSAARTRRSRCLGARHDVLEHTGPERSLPRPPATAELHRYRVRHAGAAKSPLAFGPAYTWLLPLKHFSEIGYTEQTGRWEFLPLLFGAFGTWRLE